MNSGGGGTRTPVPQRRPRASPSAAADSVSVRGGSAATLPRPSPQGVPGTAAGAPPRVSLLSTPDPSPQARDGGRLPNLD